jgi:hypothetical protein
MEDSAVAWSRRVFSRLRFGIASLDDRVEPMGRSHVKVVLAVTAAVLAIIGVVWKVGGAGAEPQVRAAMKCWSCGRTEHRPLRVGEMIPGTCAGCGRKTFAPAYPCPKCKSLVVLNEYRDGKPPTRCERCGREVRHGD